jgi:hypothetical protein
MSAPTNGWKNKKGTVNRSCGCGSWKNHWINVSGKAWPIFCSVQGCLNFATLGAHVINSAVSGEQIIPMCESCNNLTTEFSLKDKITLVSANVSNTCGK